MNKEIAQELKTEAERVSGLYSNPDREGNYAGEKFMVQEIIPTSDATAVVIYKKSTGKFALALFYYIARGVSKGWKYLFPTDSHILGFRAFETFKLQAERNNYKYNFREDLT